MRNTLVLLVAPLFILTCASPQPAPPAGGSNQSLVAGGGPCASSKDPDRPVVCVDDSRAELSVSPDPFWLHETPSKGSATPAVQWFTTSGRGDLRVVFADERCVRNVVCTGGHCTAVASRLSPGEKERRCKYDVELTGHPTLDPEGVLTGCCVEPDA